MPLILKATTRKQKPLNMLKAVRMGKDGGVNCNWYPEKTYSSFCLCVASRKKEHSRDSEWRLSNIWPIINWQLKTPDEYKSFIPGKWKNRLLKLWIWFTKGKLLLNESSVAKDWEIRQSDHNFRICINWISLWSKTA